MLSSHKVILIGASTGGPGHIKKILQALPVDFDASIIIAQHMGNEYIPSFIKQLSANSVLPISAISSRTKVELSKIYICSQLSSFIIDNQQLYVLQKQRDNEGYNPDINHLFSSMADISSKLNVMAIILTGIGDDGILGCQLLAKNKAYCIAESAQTAIVDGMPMQARNQIKDIHVFSLDEIIAKIRAFGV